MRMRPEILRIFAFVGIIVAAKANELCPGECELYGHHRFDFNTQDISGNIPASGTKISDNYPGVIISTSNAKGESGPATVLGSSAPSFDTADLITPGYGNGNTASLGNILILNDEEKAETEDVSDGGAFIFDFICAVKAISITLLDVEYPPSASGDYYVTMYGITGKVLKTMNIPSRGDNSMQNLQLGEIEGVMKLDVTFGTEAAIGSLFVEGSCGPTIPSGANCPSSCPIDGPFALDFNAQDTTNNVLVAGSQISNEFDGVTITAYNEPADSTGPAIIFDTSHPIGNLALITPGYGEHNDNSLGKVLMISNEELTFGWIAIEFQCPVRALSIAILNAYKDTTKIRLYDDKSQLLATFTTNITHEDNDVEVIDLDKTDRVKVIKVFLSNAAAIGNVKVDGTCTEALLGLIDTDLIPAAPSPEDPPNQTLTIIVPSILAGAAALVLIAYASSRYSYRNAVKKRKTTESFQWQFGLPLRGLPVEMFENLPKSIDIFKILDNVRVSAWMKVIDYYNESTLGQAATLEEFIDHSRLWKSSCDEFFMTKLAPLQDSQVLIHGEPRSFKLEIISQLLIPLAKLESESILTTRKKLKKRKKAKKTNVRDSLSILQRACKFGIPGCEYYLMDKFLRRVLGHISYNLRESIREQSPNVWRNITDFISICLRFICTFHPDYPFSIRVNGRSFVSSSLIQQLGDFLNSPTVAPFTDILTDRGTGLSKQTRTQLSQYQVIFVILTRIHHRSKNKTSIHLSLDHKSNEMQQLQDALSQTPDFENKNEHIRKALNFSFIGPHYQDGKYPSPEYKSNFRNNPYTSSGSDMSSIKTHNPSLYDDVYYQYDRRRRSTCGSAQSQLSPEELFKREMNKDHKEPTEYVVHSGLTSPRQREIKDMELALEIKQLDRSQPQRARRYSHSRSSENRIPGVAVKGQIKKELKLPEGWHAALDPTRQKLYYYNDKTKVRTWRNPSITENDRKAITASLQAMTPRTRSRSLSVGSKNLSPIEAKKRTPRRSSVVSRRKSVVTLKPKNIGITLPQGWFGAFDAVKEKVYYYNKDTGERRWTLPESAAFRRSSIRSALV
eukprot:CAMPEP_0167748988 /NCGR_PEP_ID=MMETSP0110_2-20121227/5146_1 /TAXON_ID=629695 /ORGANISM="Gymnochlora sp., Strain CCMP2014" /LENGTH=1071 /DNA_ID=CAMNT_0007634069 /DNA_START=69 /DNA_END=3284 /DNA_ORIENTATION=+